MFIDPDGLELFEMPGLKLTHDEIDAGLLKVEWTILQPATMFRTAGACERSAVIGPTFAFTKIMICF